MTCLTPYFCVGSSTMNIRAPQQPQNICITIVQRRPNVLTLGRRCLKVIQMFCVYWGGFSSDRHDCATIRLSIPLTVSHFQKYYIYKILCFRRCQVVISFPAHESPLSEPHRPAAVIVITCCPHHATNTQVTVCYNAATAVSLILVARTA